MSNYANVVGGPLGYEFGTVIRKVTNRVGTRLVGDTSMLVQAQQDGDVSSYDFGATDSIFTNVIQPATAYLTAGGIMCLWVSASTAVDTQGLVCFYGIAKGNVIGTNACALTDLLAVENATDTLQSDAVALNQLKKVFAIPLEVTAGATEQTIDVWFDGLHGFGYEENL